ncbi:MAG: PAS domain S-box protein [Proteobacteria bacterium]|nr:PAS domain S-box protein [Pseudomonadota bacterium]
MVKSKDAAKTKEQLLKELAEMRRLVKQIQKSENRYKHFEEALNKSEDKYRKLVELANSIILQIDTNGNITFFNEYAQKFFGYTRNEIIGKNVIGTIVPRAESSGRDLTNLIETIRQNPEQHVVHENENTLKDGSRVWVLWANSIVLDESGHVTEILCIGSDITARKEAEKVMQTARDELEAKVHERTFELKKTYEDLLYETAERKVYEEALRESETKYRSIVEGTIEGIFQTTAEGKCTMANTSLARLLGYASPEKFVSAASNMEEQMYVNPDRCIEFKNLLQSNGYAKGFETEFYKKDRSKIWVSMNVQAVYDERGNFIFYEGTVIDITLRHVLNGTTSALSMAVEIRDPYTAGHQARVTQLATAIAKEMNFSDDHIEAIQTAGMLHDIGKIYVPAEFLSRPGSISTHELSVLRDHSNAGYEILKNIEYEYPIAEIVYEHHERMNGSGYPRGLSGDQILMEARIIAVADVVESMASHRPYRPSLGTIKALNEIKENRGTLYDAAVVDICLGLFNEKGFCFEL